MLLVGLTGGIASGKSTVAGWLRDLGAEIIDADVLARQALAAHSPGLSAVGQRFGSHLIDGDGNLDRAGLAAVIFGDDQARADLEAIVHPAVERGFAARVAAAPSDAIVVYDVPLLVENSLASRYHLVAVTQAPRDMRIERAMQRGMTRAEVEARMNSQASDDERRKVADLVISTARSPHEVQTELEHVWHERLVPYEANLRSERRAERSLAALRMDDPRDPWAPAASRILQRLLTAGGHLIADAAHIGSTSVPGLVAKDVLDLQIGVRNLDNADALAPLLASAGFPQVLRRAHDTPKPWAPDPGMWTKSFHANADPGRAANLHVRVTGSPGWEWALCFRDWLRSDERARGAYAELKLETLRQVGSELSPSSPTFAYAEAKEPWFTEVADHEMRSWSERTSWSAGSAQVLRPGSPQA